MNTSSLDDQLANAWSASAAHAALDGPPNHEALMRRVRSRRRRTYAVRGTATAVACLALTGGGVAIASTLKGQGFAPATSPSESSSTTPTTGASDSPPAGADPATGGHVVGHARGPLAPGGGSGHAWVGLRGLGAFLGRSLARRSGAAIQVRRGGCHVAARSTPRRRPSRRCRSCRPSMRQPPARTSRPDSAA